MKRLLDELQEFEGWVKAPRRDIVPSVLSLSEERVFRSLKTQGERATKGREIEKCAFEVRTKHGVSLMMLMEGRHAMSVANQVSRMFESTRELEFAKVVRTKRGAYVVLRMRESDA